MVQQRRQAVRLLALLVVTVVLLGACSSRDPEDGSVTTSGGSGAEFPHGGARSLPAEGAAELSAGGTFDFAGTSSMNDGGSGEEPTARDPEPAPDDQLPSSGGTGSVGGSPHATGGMLDAPSAGAPAGSASTSGAPGAGAPATGGAPAVAGAPSVAEPVCDPARERPTGDLFLPCDVSTALYVCRNCHSNPPVKGVFTSYVTYADIKANAAQIYGVIKSGSMPWPPYTLSTWQKATALKWLGKNGSCALGATKSCQ